MGFIVSYNCLMLMSGSWTRYFSIDECTRGDITNFGLPLLPIFKSLSKPPLVYKAHHFFKVITDVCSFLDKSDILTAGFSLIAISIFTLIFKDIGQVVSFFFKKSNCSLTGTGNISFIKFISCLKLR